MRRFEFVEGTSSKFWQIVLNGVEFTVRYGKIGTDGTEQTKAWPSTDKAKSEYDKLIRDKTSKGYVEVTNGAGGDDDDAVAVEVEEVEEVDGAGEHDAGNGSRRFEFVEGTSSKFWEIALNGTEFTVTYGKIGTAGSAQTKSWPSEAKAKAEHDKLIAEKTGKGYAEVGNGVAAKPVAAAPKAAPPAAVEEAAEAPADAGEGEGARRFEFVDGSSSKFWEIALSGTEFTVTYGKIGTAGTAQTKSWPSADKAKAEYDKLIKEKTGKGYEEVGAPAASAGAPAVRAAATPKAAKAPRAEVTPSGPVSNEGWVDAGGGYSLGIREGDIVARNDKGKVLASLPKQVKDTEILETLEGAVEFLALHAAECKEAVETWMLRSLPVPRSILHAIWADPDWRVPLENLVVDAQGVVGILRAVEDRGLGVVDLDGETRWLAADAIRIPHPILLGELDDWRSLLAELAIAQGTAQLFRETFPKPADPNGSSVDEFSGGSFDMLAQVNNAARKLGYRVSGGCAVCRVWEAGQLIEARYYIGDGDPMYETSTGSLAWVDSRQQSLMVSQVGVVAFSEGMRMASALYAKRKIEEKEEGEDV